MTLVNDEVPVLVPGLKPILACAEGQEVVITMEYICATDPDSDDSTLMYMIARQPYHGIIQRKGIVVDRFIQADIIAGLISYRHTGNIRTIVMYFFQFLYTVCVSLSVVELNIQPYFDLLTLISTTF